MSSLDKYSNPYTFPPVSPRLSPTIHIFSAPFGAFFMNS